MNPQDMYNNYGYDLDTANAELEKITLAINNLGCGFSDVGCGELPPHLYMDLSIPVDKFSVDLLVKCCMIWKNYNNKMEAILREEYNVRC